MVAIESAQFTTLGNSVQSGSPFNLVLTMRNETVSDQEYNIKVIHSKGDPISGGTKLASIVATIPSAVVGGYAKITIPLRVTAPEGTALNIFVIAYPRCPKKRMPGYDCSNILYPVGTLTVTRDAGQGYVTPFGVVYPKRVWTGESLPSGLGIGGLNGKL